MTSSHPLLVALLLLGGCTSRNPAYLEVDGSNPLPWEAGMIDAGRDGQPPTDSVSLPDGFACTPNAFLQCKGNNLVRCNTTGTGIVAQTCAPFDCNTVAQRCDLCDPESDPTCSGSNVVSCTADGLETITPCPLGCVDGKCNDCQKTTYYADQDQDGYGDPNQKQESCNPVPGYVETGGDCNDADDDAHPQQQSFFYAPTKVLKDYDYNCDGTEEQQFPDKVNCVKSSGGCSGDGWGSNKVPDCGNWASWITCQNTPYGSSCTQITSFKVQYCR